MATEIKISEHNTMILVHRLLLTVPTRVPHRPRTAPTRVPNPFKIRVLKRFKIRVLKRLKILVLNLQHHHRLTYVWT